MLSDVASVPLEAPRTGGRQPDGPGTVQGGVPSHCTPSDTAPPRRLAQEHTSRMTTTHSPLISSGRRAPRRPWWRWLGIALGIALLVVVVAGVLAGVLWAYSWVRLGPDQLTVLEEDLTARGGEPPRAPADATTYLVMVTEPVRDPTVPTQPALAAPVLLVQVGGPRTEPAVVALPENLPVAREGDGLLTLQQIQAAGGPDGIVRALTDYTSVALDHLVIATTELLPELLGPLGPVERCGVTGCREITADEVRGAVTQGSAEERIRSVVDVLPDLAGDLDVGFVMRHPLVTRRAIDALADELITDVSLRGRALFDLAEAFAVPTDVEVVTIEAETDPDTSELIVLPERAELRFAQLRDGLPLVPDEPEDPDGLDDDPFDGTRTPAEDQPTLAVVNGAGVAGLAGDIAARIEAAGFAVLGTGNAPTFDREVTEVAYDQDDSDAQELAEQVADLLRAVPVPVPTTLSFEAEPVAVLVTVGADLDESE